MINDENRKRPSQKETLTETVRELESIPGAIKQVYNLLHSAESKTKIFPVSNAEPFAELIKRGFFTETEDPEPLYKDWQLLSLFESRGGIVPEQFLTYTQKKKWCVDHPKQLGRKCS